MIYYASRSTVRLETVCEGLRRQYDLPKFEYDYHDTWRYGWSNRNGLGLNITRARGYRTVETWITGCPSGANYQLIVTAECEPSDFKVVTTELLRAKVVRFYERTEPIA